MADGLRTLDVVLGETDRVLTAGHAAAPRVWATGFAPLDDYLGGGVRAGELTLLGGPQGGGKTTWTLQVLRNVAAAGGSASYFSFEHDEQTLLERLLCVEAGALLGDEGLRLSDVRTALETEARGVGLRSRLDPLTGGTDVLAALGEWAAHVHLERSSGATTTVADLRRRVEQAVAAGDAPVVFVDYLQKLNADGPARDLPEAEQVTAVVEGLKDLALDFAVPVVAIVAADTEGLVTGKRLRVHHLRGSSALAYEADVVLLLNDKYDVVARHHLVYDVGNIDRFRDWVVLSIEKNRTGVDRVDLEFRKRFDQSRFEPAGRPVEERLVDERVYVE